MVFEQVGRPLRAVERPIPEPGPGQLLLRVHACGVCRTDLHLLDGEVEIAAPPRILGHQIVGTSSPASARRRAALTPGASAAWASRGWAGPTASARYCTLRAREPLPNARFTGRDIDGGYAEYAVADERYCFPIPPATPSEQAAPLLCAGLIGYRALRMAATRGVWASTASATPRTSSRQVAAGRAGECSPSPGPATRRRRTSRASSAPSGRAAPTSRRREPLDAAIIFAPVGALVPAALRAVRPGGTSSAAAST